MKQDIGKNKWWILGGLVVLYFIYKKFFGSGGDDARATQQTLDAVRDELQHATEPPSFDDSVYASTSNLIQTLLDGPEMGNTELQVVDEVIRVVKNKTDWLKLQLAFGSRDITDANFVSTTKYELSQLLRDQLDTKLYYWTIDYPHYSASGYFDDSIDVLRQYFNRINIPL